MFTGIIEETGKLRSLQKGSDSCVIAVSCQTVLEGTKVGDSIAVNGICLTVTNLLSDSFTADVMNETLNRSSLGNTRPGECLNLERAMAADGRFGGHIVSGHIDGTGVIREIRKDANAVWYVIETEPDILRYIVEKGSIAIDGISLTVAKLDNTSFQVSVIPHTRAVTALTERTVGSVVNLENDIIGKYVEKLIKPYQPNDTAATSGGISMEFLAQNGF